MNTSQTPPVNVVAMRAEAYSDEEKKSLIISLTTKFSGAERKYSVPLECFCDLVNDMQRLDAYDRVDSQLFALIRNCREDDSTDNLGPFKLET